MENRQQQILSEIQSMMSAIRAELNMLDAKISEFQQIADAAGNEPEPIDLASVEFLEVIAEQAHVSEPVMESIVEQTLDDSQESEAEADDDAELEMELDAEAEVEEELEAEIEEELETEVEAEPEVELDVEPEVEPEVKEEVEPVTEFEPNVVAEPEPAPADEDDDLPFFDEPELILTQEKVQPEVVEEKPAAAVTADVENLAWWKDEPASAVKDVRSAISLNDRIVFINKLFAEDPIAFQTAIGKINAMTSLSEVVEYVTSEFSGWSLESDIVYRFMMAVRRKVR